MLDIKRIIIVILGVFFISLIILGVCYFINNNKEEQIKEYTPQEEISDEQMRQTMISLYFRDNNNLIPEARLIDVKELINEPYEKILNMLLEGPKNDNLQKIFPEGTKINKIERQGENLVLDFNEKILEIQGEENEKILINSLVKTLTELTEINGIKININGEENKQFTDGIIKFNKIFNKNFQ